MRYRVMLMAAMLLTAVGPPAEAGKVYKWTDAQGRTHFSDHPLADDAEELRIRSFSGPADVVVDGEDFGPREVKLLSTVWCGVCKRAKAYLSARNIHFTEYDVETSEIGRQEYKRLQGKGVPIILVGKQRMDGFSATQLDRMLKNVGYP